jgi:hypothetical protein
MFEEEDQRVERSGAQRQRAAPRLEQQEALGNIHPKLPKLVDRLT